VLTSAIDISKQTSRREAIESGLHWSDRLPHMHHYGAYGASDTIPRKPVFTSAD
jgi:hypothetical protein